MGDIAIAENVNFTWKDWFSGKYQQKKEEYLNTNVGFYADLIRINNQIDFSLFGILHAKYVVEGVSHYLYEVPYIDSYFGTDKRTDASLLHDCLEIKEIQDKLLAQGKEFLFVIATNKTDFYPENLPLVYQKNQKKPRNYSVYLKYFDSLGIQYIDFNAYFMNQKGKTKYPLITKFNTHWSSYGAALVVDSLLKYFGTLPKMGDLAMPDISYRESMTYNSHDREAFDPLNLIVGWKDREITATPVYNFNTIRNENSPKILCLADSYFWEIYNQKVLQSVFGDLEFWYYNREHWNKNGKLLGDAASNPELGKGYLKQCDVVLMMASEFHLNCLNKGIVQKLIL